MELWTGVISKTGGPDGVCAEAAEENKSRAKQHKRSDRIRRSLRPKPTAVNPCSRLELPSLVLDASIHRDPIYFPGFATIVRKRLLETTRICGYVLPDIFDQDHAAVKFFLIEKFAAAVLEFADGWNAEGSYAAVREVQAPLMRLWIVKPQRNTFDVAAGAIRLQFHHVGAAIPDFSHHRRAVIFDPGGRAG